VPHKLYPGASPEQPWYRRPGWPLRSIYIVSRQSLYLLDPPSAHIPSSEKPGVELPTDCLRGSRFNHRLGGPVGVMCHICMADQTLEQHRRMSIRAEQGRAVCTSVNASSAHALWHMARARRLSKQKANPAGFRAGILECSSLIYSYSTCHH